MDKPKANNFAEMCLFHSFGATGETKDFNRGFLFHLISFYINLNNYYPCKAIVILCYLKVATCGLIKSTQELPTPSLAYSP